ncbi:flagellar biosynthesis protein FlhB [Clostridium sp. C105KSO13]|uniref:flagellar biosynthesis protein FlhB n=1 Tax=Clostridium sp. C105KSO13 TaxID=1776045 RepID=UPI0007406B62|nr:flagellar biosynthesis protein FlhB [Clostridium sp. C105KSO13]CUX49414.1 Flagellar biosynthetic protein FlhB [Clostridium sp. C105KSO13]
MAADSKTEKATPKKRRDERKEGNVFKSTDVANVAFVFIAFYSLKKLFPSILKTVSDFMKHYLDLAGSAGELNLNNIGGYGREFAAAAAKTILPFAFICVAVGVIIHGVQTRFLFTPKNFYPKFNRISPIRGIKNLFSLKNVIELVKNILKVIVLVAILYNLLKTDAETVMRTMDMPVSTSVTYMFDRMMTMITKVSLVFVVIAIFDYMFQRWDYERKIRMSKQELKEEFKQTEGNPEIKGRIRELQKQRARTRMMQAVPEADVIIRNPTHFAVALLYDMDKNNAPVVVAKGQDDLALRIVRVGEEHKVAVIEDVPLARGLYAQAEINHEIPMEYYGAVAEVLVFVYKMNKKNEVKHETVIK